MLDCVIQRAEAEERNRISCSRNFAYTLTFHASTHGGWNCHLHFLDEVTQIQSLENPSKGPANKERDDRVYNLFEGPGWALKWQEKG